MGKCQTTPDWDLFDQAEVGANASLDPISFFGCDPGTSARYGNQAFIEDNLQSSPQPASSQMCMADDHAVPPAPRLGLDAYDVVPDNFVGALAPNQIHASDRATLDQYSFGDFQVVADDFVGPLQNGQMRQSDYASMQQAWLNISHGQGIHMSGSAEDQEQFMQMMRGTMAGSPTMRGLISTIGNDADPAHTIQADLGQGQNIAGTGTGVWGDQFSTNQIDLTDMAHFPAAPGAAHPNELTQTELLAHILAERRDAVTSANPADFLPHHNVALGVQNQVRAENHQSAVTSQTGTLNAAGGVDGVFQFADGSQQQVQTDANNNPTGSTF